MKKVLIFILALILVTLCGCGIKTAKKTNKLNVVTTIFPAYDFAKQVGGDNVELTMLLKPGAESHTYEPTPQDIMKIQKCDVFIYVGGESDEWVRSILDSIDTSKIKVISMMDLVDHKVEEETVEGMQTEEKSDGEKEYDEHVWTSPVNAMQIVRGITKTMVSVDSKNKKQYENNRDAYLKQLEELDKQFKDVVKNAKRDTLVFGSRFPFRYFVEQYGLKYYAAFPGCAAETEASAATIAFLIDKVKKEKIPVVFDMELSGSKFADTICETTGAKKLTLYACHNVSAQDFSSGVTYVSLMKRNVENLKVALQ